MVHTTLVISPPARRAIALSWVLALLAASHGGSAAPVAAVSASAPDPEEIQHEDIPPSFCALDPVEAYCTNVGDPCCGPGFTAELDRAEPITGYARTTGGFGWVCNNAQYVDWFAARCRR